MDEGIYRLGANVKNGDLFEGLWPIPDGVSLNSYIVQGEKTALIDLVKDWDNAPSKLEDQLKSININIENIDYLVLNHRLGRLFGCGPYSYQPIFSANLLLS